VLGVPLDEQDASAAGRVLEGAMELLLEERQRSRDRRDFARADTLRDRLAEMGVSIEDTSEGSRWRLE